MVTIAKFAWCYIEKPKARKPADHVERQLENACLHHMYIQETVFTCLHVEAGPTRSEKKSCYSVRCVQICGAVAALLAFTCHILQNGLLSLMQICTGTVQKLPKPRAIILIPDADHCKHLKPFHFGQNMCCDFPQRCIMCAKDQ